MDPNRTPSVACTTTFDDCLIAYTQYHSFVVDIFKNYVRTHTNGAGKRFEQGLILDIHGQSHAEGWNEIGYAHTDAQLNAPGDLNFATTQSTIDYMVSKSASYSYEQIIRGPDVSIGGLFESIYNITCIPSPRNRGPGTSGNYFNGGYTVQTHGSYTNRNEPFSAIQVESPIALRSPLIALNAYIPKFADVIFRYYYLHGFDKMI